MTFRLRKVNSSYSIRFDVHSKIFLFPVNSNHLNIWWSSDFSEPGGMLGIRSKWTARKENRQTHQGAVVEGLGWDLVVGQGWGRRLGPMEAFKLLEWNIGKGNNWSQGTSGVSKKGFNMQKVTRINTSYYLKFKIFCPQNIPSSAFPCLR